MDTLAGQVQPVKDKAVDVKIPCTISRYNIPDERIKCSSVSPNMLYILTDSYEIYSLRISTLTLTKMDISGLESRKHIEVLLCHDGFIYIVQWFGSHIGATIHKCAIERSSGLRAIGSYTCSTRRKHMLSHMLDMRGGHLYFSTSTNIDIIDSDTMTLVSTILLPCLFVIDIAVAEGGVMHIATVDGVRVCTHTTESPRARAGQSYLRGVFCMSIRCTSDGCSIVGMKEKVVVVSRDLTPVYHISAASICAWCCLVTCDAADDSVVIMDVLNRKGSLVIVPPEAYRPPFSLHSLCVSTILRHANELPISLLPTRLYKLVKQYI